VRYNSVITIKANKCTQCYNTITLTTKSYMYIFRASIACHQGAPQFA